MRVVEYGSDERIFKLTGASGTESIFLPLIPYAAQQSLSGAGAVNITSFATKWTTTAADAGTLADGSFIGQQKVVVLVSDGGDGTLTPATFGDGTTITFADVGDLWWAVWDGTAWETLLTVNVASGDAGPAIA